MKFLFQSSLPVFTSASLTSGSCSSPQRGRGAGELPGVVLPSLRAAARPQRPLPDLPRPARLVGPRRGLQSHPVQGAAEGRLTGVGGRTGCAMATTVQGWRQLRVGEEGGSHWARPALTTPHGNRGVAECVCRRGVLQEGHTPRRNSHT